MSPNVPCIARQGTTKTAGKVQGQLGRDGTSHGHQRTSRNEAPGELRWLVTDEDIANRFKQWAGVANRFTQTGPRESLCTVVRA